MIKKFFFAALLVAVSFANAAKFKACTQSRLRLRVLRFLFPKEMELGPAQWTRFHVTPDLRTTTTGKSLASRSVTTRPSLSRPLESTSTVSLPAPLP